MRYLILLFVCSISHAETFYGTPVALVYQLSCERTMLRMFAKYGAGKLTPPEQEKFAIKYCSETLDNIDKANAWKTMGSPAGTACMDVVRSLIEVAPKRYPSKDDLFIEFCYSITKRDG